MSTNRSYPSTFVEMEVPEVETPRWQPPVSIIYNGFGKPYDDTDPLNYLTRCQDFMAFASFSRGRSFSYITHSPVWEDVPSYSPGLNLRLFFSLRFSWRTTDMSWRYG